MLAGKLAAPTAEQFQGNVPLTSLSRNGSVSSQGWGLHALQMTGRAKEAGVWWLAPRPGERPAACEVEGRKRESWRGTGPSSHPPGSLLFQAVQGTISLTKAVKWQDVAFIRCSSETGTFARTAFILSRRMPPRSTTLDFLSQGTAVLDTRQWAPIDWLLSSSFHLPSKGDAPRSAEVGA